MLYVYILSVEDIVARKVKFRAVVRFDDQETAPLIILRKRILLQTVRQYYRHKIVDLPVSDMSVIARREITRIVAITEILNV